MPAVKTNVMGMDFGKRQLHQGFNGIAVLLDRGRVVALIQRKTPTWAGATCARSWRVRDQNDPTQYRVADQRGYAHQRRRWLGNINHKGRLWLGQCQRRHGQDLDQPPGSRDGV